MALTRSGSASRSASSRPRPGGPDRGRGPPRPGNQFQRLIVGAGCELHRISAAADGQGLPALVLHLHRHRAEVAAGELAGGRGPGDPGGGVVGPVPVDGRHVEAEGHPRAQLDHVLEGIAGAADVGLAVGVGVAADRVDGHLVRPVVEAAVDGDAGHGDGQRPLSPPGRWLILGRGRLGLGAQGSAGDHGGTLGHHRREHAHRPPPSRRARTSCRSLSSSSTRSIRVDPWNKRSLSAARAEACAASRSTLARKTLVKGNLSGPRPGPSIFADSPHLTASRYAVTLLDPDQRPVARRLSLEGGQRTWRPDYRLPLIGSLPWPTPNSLLSLPGRS